MRGIQLLLACVLLAPAARAQDDSYFSVDVRNVEITEGKLPAPGSHWRFGGLVRAALDGPGEAYVTHEGPSSWQPESSFHARILVRAPAGKDVTGILAYPGGKARFRIPATLAAAAKDDFTAAKRAHAQRLLDLRYAGAGHWRHILHEATGKRELDERRLADGRRRRSEYADTYDLLSGGRAVAENLQLHRGLLGGARAEATVPLESIQGITVREFDWTEYLGDVDISVDALASRIPADQYAVFFPSFDVMIATLDAAEKHGTPALQATELRAEDAGTKKKYEDQLSLRTSALARLLGPKLVRSVAFTGSDPFLREGTDVAVLFEAKDADALETLLRANRLKNAAEFAPKLTTTNREIGTHPVHGIETADRVVRSFQVRFGDVVIVSNSMAQIEKLLAVKSPMADLDEYTFFRRRYPVDDESAFVILTDAAIRRWCGPRWRIAMSRRVRAAAALAALEAEQEEAMVKGVGIGARLPNDFAAIDLGEAVLTARGATSSIYGNTRFLTPISELELTHATEAEATGYNEWRDGYQRNWSNYFDPIAVQLKLTDERLAADVTVMPLIVSSEYNRFIRLAGESRITPGTGDPHDALFQFLFAFDHDSEVARMFGAAFTSWPGLKPRTNPLRWLGPVISFSIDGSPLFAEAAQAEDGREFVEKNLHRLPIVLNFDVVDPLVAGIFLTGLRTMVENTAPGYTKWSNGKHGDLTYVRIEPGEQMSGEMDKLAIHYATVRGALIVGIDEEAFKAAIDRHAARLADPDARKHEWLGEHVAGRAHRDIFRALDSLAGDEGIRGEMQRISWKNIPILDEWRRLFPGNDPVALHQKLTGVRLICPGGGTYVWNEEWQTYESSVFGHEGAPKRGPDDCLPFAGFTWGEFGVTFEKEGLRARVRITK